MDSTSFTFLATILILVLLSASLVLRSYILRRRYRQHLQHAFASRLLDASTPFHGPGRFDALADLRHPAHRTKPFLWDICSSTDNDLTGGWSSITPIAVRCVPSLSPPTTASSPGPSPQPTFFSQFRLASPFSRSRSSLAGPSDPLHSGTRSPPADKGAARLTITVLVSMPDPSFPVHRAALDIKGKGVDPPDEALPVLEFGVVEIAAGEWACDS